MVLVWIAGLARDNQRFTEASWLELSIYFSCIPEFLDIGFGIGGLKQAPLNFTMNSRSPSQVPAEKPKKRQTSMELDFYVFIQFFDIFNDY